MDPSTGADKTYSSARTYARQAARDETGLGDRVFSKLGQFYVLKRGRIVSFLTGTTDTRLMADQRYVAQVHDDAKPVVMKVVDAI